MIKIIISGLDNRPITTLGIGVFDGLHLGHQAIQKESDALLSFDPHPDILLNKNSTLKYLSTLKERAFYCNRLLSLSFNKEISRLSPREFLEQVILEKLAPKRIVVGYDFKFGHHQEGNVETLKAWGKEHDIEVIEVEAIKDKQGRSIKSSLIRTMIQDDFNSALDLLGHPYPIIGEVVKGDGRGKKLGFPTANLKTDPRKLLPETGVYKGHVLIKNTVYKAGIYIGSKPSFKGEKIGVEVHVQDFSDNLYGQSLMVFLDKKLRGEQHFSSQEDLILQIEKDLN